jgi:YHS domain-containing protein
MNRFQKNLVTALSLFAVVAIIAAGATTTLGRSEDVKKNPHKTKAMQESRAYLNSHNLPSTGLALEGYCPVAYFAADKAIRGKAKYASTYKDVTYYFVSADAKKLFDGNPEKYLPAYGGWCAFGMAVKDKFPVDPTNFKIVEGKLLVFLKNKNVDAHALWNKGNEAQLIRDAASHWKKVSK